MRGDSSLEQSISYCFELKIELKIELDFFEIKYFLFYGNVNSLKDDRRLIRLEIVEHVTYRT